MNSSAEPSEVVRLVGVSKSFGPTRALREADLQVRAGEIHALLGENGAGKTTLMRILAGLLRPDAGSVRIQDRETFPRDPGEAASWGIGMVHQHFTLVQELTVLENLALGVRNGAGWRSIDAAGLRSRVGALSERTGLRIDLDRPLEGASVGERQRIEILKVLLRDPDLLILDEPTAVLTPGEVDRLLDVVRTLAGQGRAVVLIGHKLDEVLSIADRVTVLRNGETVFEAERSEVTASALADVMVGRSLESGSEGVAGGSTEIGREVARIEGGEWVDSSGRVRLRGVDLAVRRGEIVGIAGVQGNGQRELALVLSGRVAIDADELRLPERPGFVPQDRTHEGLIADFTLTENVALALQHDDRFVRRGWMRWGAIASEAATILERFEVRPADPDARAAALSGGNQQKVVVGREFTHGSDLVVAENPTRGLDLAATQYVRESLRTLCRRGVAVGCAKGIVLISNDLDEIEELADRILVMVRGRLIHPATPRPSRSEIGRIMLSGADGESEPRTVPRSDG